MLEKYNLNNGLTIQMTGRLWSDTTMIDLFFCYLRLLTVNKEEDFVSNLTDRCTMIIV